MRFSSTIAILLLASSIPAAVPPAQLPYSQDALPATAFDPRGSWKLNEIAGFSETHYLGKHRRRKLLGTTLDIGDTTATFWNRKVWQWNRLATARIGQETYDTQSREFWLDFRTDPQALHLPRYVTSVDLELGQLVVVSPERMLFDYEGVWYAVTRSSRIS